MKRVEKTWRILGMFLIFVVFSVTVLSGCGKTAVSSKGEPMTVTDLAGREVKLNGPVNKVVLQWSGSGGGFITMLALEGKNVHQRIAGWDMGLKENRYDMWKTFSDAIPELDKLPDVGNVDKDTFTVEKVVSLKPDVVILPLTVQKQTADTVQKLAAAGIPTLFIDYHLETVENHTKSTLLLGKILGKEQRAQEIANYHKEQMTKIFSRLEKITAPKPRVYVEAGSEGPGTYGNTYGGYMWGALVEKCGGINIAKDKIEKFAPINPEFLLKANPDIIVLTGAYWPKKTDSLRLGYLANREESKQLLANFTKRPGWETLDAVKNNQIYSINHGIAREIYDAVVMQYFAKVFYPQEFIDIDPVQTFKEFHQKFLPVEFSGVWMLNLKE
ncbi:MAG TPA: ABC transporter substrate-binding protein [Patescibacteria group bacterium]|nr:ABC transporter substrate-binding protein [Patescibacteria group bacterium]